MSAPGSEGHAQLRGEVLPSSDPTFETPADFPLTVVGSSSAPVEFVLHNPTGAPTTRFTIAVTNVAASEYRIVDSDCDQPVPSGSSCRLHIAFQPASTGVRNAVLGASGEVCGSGTASLQLEGTGYVP